MSENHLPQISLTHGGRSLMVAFSMFPFVYFDCVRCSLQLWISSDIVLYISLFIVLVFIGDNP